MKTLTGSEKQIKWAEQIREAFLSKNLKDKFNKACAYHLNADKSVDCDEIYEIDLSEFVVDGVKFDLDLLKKYQEQDILGIIEEQPEAKFWIENRFHFADNTIPFAKYIDDIISSINGTRQVGFAYFRAI